MKLTTRRLSARTRHPFQIARAGGSVSGRHLERVIVRLEHEGTFGYGEAAPSPYYRQSVESVEDAVARAESSLGNDPFRIGPIVDGLLARFDDQRAAVAAIDAALHDWVGRRLNVPVWRLLGLDPAGTPATSMTIGIDEPDRVGQKVAEAGDFGILKVKVGTERDADILSTVRGVAPEKRLRLDANGAWDSDVALERIMALARFQPELIEQPLPAGEMAALRLLHQESPIPIYVDEDCVRLCDVPRLAGRVTGVNVKLAKCGGIREALRTITLARAHGLKIMFGCMVETSLGVAAAAHCASMADLVDLDGHLLIEDEPFGGLILEGDRVLPSDRPGLGVDAGGAFE